MQYINMHRRDQHSALLVSKRSGSSDLIFQQQKGKETSMYMYMSSVHVLIIMELTITCTVQQIHVHALGLMFGFFAP